MCLADAAGRHSALGYLSPTAFEERVPEELAV